MENWKPGLPSRPEGLDGPTIHALEATFNHWLNRIQSRGKIEDGDLIGFAYDPSAANSSAAPLQEHGSATQAERVAVMRVVWALRRARSDIFPFDIFADPAWDLLIDLYLAKLESRRISVSSACIASCVPPTTALRWIANLVEKGLIVRKADPFDGRRIFVELSADAERMMAAWSTIALGHLR